MWFYVYGEGIDRAVDMNNEETYQDLLKNKPEVFFNDDFRNKFDIFDVSIAATENTLTIDKLVFNILPNDKLRCTLDELVKFPKKYLQLIITSNIKPSEIIVSEIDNRKKAKDDTDKGISVSAFGKLKPIEKIK
jgi:hypothetical protein